jgi:squalene cyclase
VHKKDVDVALQSCISWFLSNKNKNGSIGLRRWEVWDTANAVLSLLHAGTPKANLEQSIEFILKSQREDGGFFYENLPPRRKDLTAETAYCIETTSVALQSLYSYFNKVTSEIKDGVNFLLDKQTKSGGWELPYLLLKKNVVDLSRNYYPSVTGYALQALVGTKSCPRNVLFKTLDFLEKTQKNDGSWGKSDIYYNTESYAIKNITKAVTLQKKRGISPEIESRIDIVLERCIKYIKKRQLNDGSWPIEPHVKGVSSKALSTSLFLQSLIFRGINQKDAADRGISWILSTQRSDGSWNGGVFYGTIIDNFVNSEVVLCLSTYKNFDAIS